MNKGLFAWLGATVLLLAAAMPAAGAEGSDSGVWEVEAQIYVWGAGIGGETTAGDDIDISFSDLVENLDMAFMGAVAARKNDWIIVADTIYMDVSDDSKGTANILNIPLKTEFDLELEAFIANLAGGHSMYRNDSTNIDLLVGVRYLWLKSTVKAQVGAQRRKIKDSGSVLDGIVGFRGETDLNQNWFLNYYADLGTGDSERTRQALASIGYRFGKADAVFGYRYLDWDFDGDHDVFDDLNLSGPFAGVRFSF